VIRRRVRLAPANSERRGCRQGKARGSRGCGQQHTGQESERVSERGLAVSRGLWHNGAVAQYNVTTGTALWLSPLWLYGSMALWHWDYQYGIGPSMNAQGLS